MLFAVIFTDKPDHGALRAAHLQAHVDWVAAHQGVVLVAGSLRTEPGAVPKGGLWIVDAAAPAAVRTLIESDPFYTCGLRQGIEVLHWTNRCWCDGRQATAYEALIATGRDRRPCLGCG
jgi:uncharacterized protein YciI